MFHSIHDMKWKVYISVKAKEKSKIMKNLQGEKKKATNNLQTKESTLLIRKSVSIVNK